jgi:hypothetical protein
VNTQSEQVRVPAMAPIFMKIREGNRLKDRAQQRSDVDHPNITR